jgi:hypothetical protein
MNDPKQYYAYYDTIETTGGVIYCGKGNEWRSNPDVAGHKRPKYNKLFKKLPRNIDLFA